MIIGADLLNVGNDSKQLGDGFERGGRATRTGLAIEGVVEHDVDLFRESSVMTMMWILIAMRLSCRDRAMD